MKITQDLANMRKAWKTKKQYFQFYHPNLIWKKTISLKFQLKNEIT